MSSGKRRFQRPLGERSYHKLFVIATEGVKTEPQYFNIFMDRKRHAQIEVCPVFPSVSKTSGIDKPAPVFPSVSKTSEIDKPAPVFNDRFIICVKCLKDNHNNSSPVHVLKRMNEYLRQNGLKLTDEAWLVVDKDRWTDRQLAELCEWSRTHNNYGFAVSNPKFEYWLLLHFEDGKGITSSQNCNERLKRYLPDYDKSVDIRKITSEQICEAVRRAKLRDTPPCADWPHTLGCTTVYKLVEKLLQTDSEDSA